jgi:hypothetical protein
MRERDDAPKKKLAQCAVRNELIDACALRSHLSKRQIGAAGELVRML